ATVGALTAEVLGAMKIVQAFNQEKREEARFAIAVEETFATARRRIALRAVMTAVTIAVIFGSITALMWRGAVQVSEGVLSGETVAVVGPSGAGKSTLFQLAMRFYDPQAGTIRLDGVPLTSVDPAEIRRRMALVPQEGTLFAASARDNLRYGAWDASEDTIWDAARSANAETFLRALPQGLDTFLGEGGARLSGGQRQRVAIARAILRDA